MRAQRPSAGAHVPRGSVVEVQLEAAPAGRPSAGRILVPVLALAGLILLALGGWRAWKWWESRPAPPPKVPRPPKPESVARPPKPPAVQKPPKAPRPQPSPQGPMVELSTVWDLGHTVLECAGPLEAAPAIHLLARANLESREVTIEHAGTVVSAVRTGDPGLEQAAAASLEGGGTATFLHRRKVAQGSAAPADRGDDRESPTGGEHE